MLRYRLSKVLRAIGKDTATDLGRRYLADTVAGDIERRPLRSFEDVLRAWNYSLHAVAGGHFLDGADQIAALLVAEAGRLGVEMEDC